MQIEIVNGDEGWPLVEALDREVYPPEVMETVPWRHIAWAHADKRIVICDGEGVRCHVGVFWRKGKIDGASVRMAGIGGVMTSSRARRRGYAGKAMQAAATLMKSETVDFGLLFCERHNQKFYQNLGWTLFGGEVWTDQPEGRIRFDLMHAMLLPLRSGPRRGLIDLCGLPW